jgi:hypothetical protein
MNLISAGSISLDSAFNILFPPPTVPPQKRKLPDDRICTGQPGRAAPMVPLNSQSTLEFSR